MIVEGRSMLPTLKSGSIVVVLKTAYGLRIPGTTHYLIRWSQPKLGDIVVFLTPSGETAVKRCTGLLGGQQFFAEGDNPGLSVDSRNYGFILTDRIIGKVWSYKAGITLSTPETQLASRSKGLLHRRIAALISASLAPLRRWAIP
jgi:signal peptidase I